MGSLYTAELSVIFLFKSQLLIFILTEKSTRWEKACWGEREGHGEGVQEGGLHIFRYIIDIEETRYQVTKTTFKWQQLKLLTHELNRRPPHLHHHPPFCRASTDIDNNH